MANWHISFSVPGRRLDEALALVHSLRVSDLGVRPINDGSPSNPAPVEPSTGGKRETRRDRIVRMLNQRMTIDQIKALIGEPGVGGVTQTLAQLAAAKRIKRLGKGVYGPAKGATHG